jgi:hypothetical protein
MLASVVACRVKRALCGRLVRSGTLRFERIAELLPRVQTALEREHIRETGFYQCERRTGARSLVGSGAVRDDRPVPRQLAQVVADLAGEQANRTGYLQGTVGPRLRTARVEEQNILAAIEPRFDFFGSNACNIRRHEW